MAEKTSREARARLTRAFRSLHSQATSVPGRLLTNRQICSAVSGVTSKRLSAWLTGSENPPPEMALRVIGVMEAHLGRRVHTPLQWNRLLQDAQKEAKGNRGGRPSSTYRPTAETSFRFEHDAAWLSPDELKGRDAELAQLERLVTGRSGYLSLVAPPWAGKTALLATFAQTHTATDLVAYFVRGRAGSDTAGDFLATMLRQLNKHAKMRPAPKGAAGLLEMYDAAAAVSAKNDRNLLLLVDGLDEDAGASIGGQSIASLLPPNPYPGMVVLVSRRWHPPLPDDVPTHHPLRHACQIENFASSPEAMARRGEVLRDLEVMLSQSGAWGREVVGFLAVADGGLTEDDLMQLVRTGTHDPPPIPFDLTTQLHSVGTRGFGLEELAPDAFVFAHQSLYAEALRGLGPDECSALRQRLHSWADGFQERGWPASTPGYLLHRYADLLSRSDDVERRTLFTLDHRRLLRLAALGRVDLALSSLDQLAQATPTPVVLASAAASKSLLGTTLRRTMPHQILQALCAVGDTERARSLALSTGDPASKAARLVGLVRSLLAAKHPVSAEQAVSLAREAAAWAERSEQQPDLTSPAAEWDALAVIPRTAVALAEAGLADESSRLLLSVDVCRPENAERAAEVAGLVRAQDPEFATWVFGELASEAESLAELPDAEPVSAIEIWAAVAAHDPGQREWALRRMKQVCEELAADVLGLTAVTCCALTASALSTMRVDNDRTNALGQARRLADVARIGALELQDDASVDELGVALALVVRALLDVGELPGEMRAMLAEFPVEIAAHAESLLDAASVSDLTEEEEAGGRDEESPLLRRIERSAALGNGPEVRSYVDQFIREAAKRESCVTWLPFLAESIACADGEAGLLLASLTDEATDPLRRVRVLATVAMSHAEAGRQNEAVRWAAETAKAAGRTDPQTSRVRALVAQALAHVGDADGAASWAQPPTGKGAVGRARIPYRRADLAVQAGAEPEAFWTRAVAEGLFGGLITASERELFDALHRAVSGAKVADRMASLRTTARARLGTEPLLATGLALLEAVSGDAAEACRTAAEIPDPAARGVAQATVANWLADVPAYLDVSGSEDEWTLSVFQALARRACLAEGGRQVAFVPGLVEAVLGTDGWYQVLPLLARTDPGVGQAVVGVLDRHRHFGADMRRG